MVQEGAFWQRLRKALADQRPQDWLRLTVLMICLVVTYYQLVDCCIKLRYPPITTHSTLSLNDSMDYPALTVCREPPYNKEVFPKFNFSKDHIGTLPYSSQWRYFPYQTYKITDFFSEAVYDKETVFSSCSLNQNSLDVVSSLHLQNGLCHTILPNFPVKNVGKKSGYSLLLNHDLYDYKPLVDNEPGWKIYVHEAREKFSENIDLLSSRQDHVFVPVGEITEVSIDAYQFNILKNCSNEENYSVTACEENCTINEDMKGNIKCTGPWLPIQDLPLCQDEDGMRHLLRATNKMRYKNCCIKNCRTTYYKIFVVKRTPAPPERNLSSTAMIYFSSKTVIQMEERFSYKWGDFLGEIGGTVGFLLGLSIVGAIGIVDKFIRFFFCQKDGTKNDKKNVN